MDLHLEGTSQGVSQQEEAELQPGSSWRQTHPLAEVLLQ